MKIFYEKQRDKELHFHLSHSLEFNAHMHESVELVYMIRGKAHAMADGHLVTLCPGDFFVVFPNCVHYYDNCEDNVAAVAVIPLDYLDDFRSIFSVKSPHSPLVQGVDPQAGDRLLSAMDYTGVYRREAVKGMLLTVMSMVLEKTELVAKNHPNENTTGAILDFCEQHFGEEISVRMISDALGISQSYISRIFTNKIHMSFRDFIKSKRLDVSLRLLRQSDKTITEIAQESGFETIRSFNRAFRERHSLSPREYRKSLFP